MAAQGNVPHAVEPLFSPTTHIKYKPRRRILIQSFKPLPEVVRAFDHRSAVFVAETLSTGTNTSSCCSREVFDGVCGPRGGG